MDSKNKTHKNTAKHQLLTLIGLAVLLALVSSFMFTSDGKAVGIEEHKTFTADVSNNVLNLKSDALSTVFSIPKVYYLAWNEKPVPEPNQSLFKKTVDSDGMVTLTYEDETISLKYWTERIHDSTCHFSEVKIAHPTQMRTAIAGGEFSGSTRLTTQAMAQQVNALVAINGDYYGYRKDGILIRQNTLYRDSVLGWDILLIDSDGNFHIMEDSKVHESGILDEYEIVNTLVFGPSLIVDGEINMLNPESGCGEDYNKYKYTSRTGIGQIGPLHYLLCCVEGRTERSFGIRTTQLAQIMYEKGCQQAYNLDGGMSSTMVINGEVMNELLLEGQRVVSDIVYFATALPNE